MYGESKPHDLAFCLIQWKIWSVLDGGNVINVMLSCIICDGPAKAFVKGTKLLSEAVIFVVINVVRKVYG